jgi:hypothetical protein
MRVFLICLLTLGLFGAARAEDISSGRVIKVLPFLLDQQGQIAKSPSLFDRDAYQAYLLDHTNEVSGIRYDVLWSGKTSGDAKFKVRVELRGIDADSKPKLKTLETEVKPGHFRQWTELPLTGDEYKSFAAVTAWRATIWDGDKLLGEQKSFLW